MLFDPLKPPFTHAPGAARPSRVLVRLFDIARSPLALPLLMAAFGFALRLHGLADKSLWFDEIVTLNRARLPLAQLITDALTHKHFPTYFLLVGPWATADADAWLLRLPSAVFGAACVFLVVRLAAELRGPFAGLVAGLLMALSPFEVQFAQEARAYTLVSCLVLVALAGLVRIAKEPAAAGLRPAEPAALRGAWAAYTFGTAGALLVQNVAMPWLLAANIAMAAIIRHAPRERGALSRNWIWSQGVILLVWLPALAMMWRANRGAALTGLEWVPKPTWESVWSAIAAVYLFRISDVVTFTLIPASLPGFGAIVVALALVGAWRLRAAPALLAAIGLAFVAMPVAMLLASAHQPVLVPRYLMWGTGPFFVLAGIGAAALPARSFALTGAIVGIGAAICLAPYYEAETKPRWNEAAAYLAANVHTQDVIVAQNEPVQYALVSYHARFRADANIPILAWDAHALPHALGERERVWVVYGRIGQGNLEPEEDFRRKWLAFGSPAQQKRFGSHILVMRFDNPAGGADGPRASASPR